MKALKRERAFISRPVDSRSEARLIYKETKDMLADLLTIQHSTFNTLRHNLMNFPHHPSLRKREVTWWLKGCAWRKLLKGNRAQERRRKIFCKRKMKEEERKKERKKERRKKAKEAVL
jgi:hypothetical protein